MPNYPHKPTCVEALFYQPPISQLIMHCPAAQSLSHYSFINARRGSRYSVVNKNAFPPRKPLTCPIKFHCAASISRLTRWKVKTFHFSSRRTKLICSRKNGNHADTQLLRLVRWRTAANYLAPVVFSAKSNATHSAPG